MRNVGRLAVGVGGIGAVTFLYVEVLGETGSTTVALSFLLVVLVVAATSRFWIAAIEKPSQEPWRSSSSTRCGACPREGPYPCGALRGDQVTFTVTDTGPGIPSEKLAHVFEPFAQVPGRALEDAGLGLTLVRLVVEDNGGRVTVQSEGGKGATFIVALPAVARA